MQNQGRNNPKFRFDALLKLRENDRDEKKSLFLNAEARRRDAEDALNALDAELEESREETRATRRDPNLDGAKLRALQTRRELLQERRRKAELELKECADLVEERRLELCEAVKNVKILENLREKDEARATEESKRRSDKELDAIAERKTARDRRNSDEE